MTREEVVRMLEELLAHPVNQALASAFAAAGVPLYVVGGPVRDALSGLRDYSDLDYTTPARPEETLKVVSPLGPTWAMGMEFGTVCVQVGEMKVEVTTHRTEAYEEGSRKPLVVFGDTIADDLRRRDLTINAMAVCLVGDGTYLPGDLVDLHGGAEDLASGTIRTPDDPMRTTDEDPLRMIRAIRFAVRRGMLVDPLLAEAIRSQVDRLGIVSVERFTEELRKVAKDGPLRVVEAFELGENLGVLTHWVGPLAASWRDGEDALSVLEGDLLDILAILTHYSVDVDANQALRDRKLSSEEVKAVLRTARLVAGLPSLDLLGARHLVRTETDETLERLRRVSRALGVDFSQVEQVWSQEAFWVRSPLPVRGEDLLERGLAGRAVGVALKRLLEVYLTRESVSREDLLSLI